MEHITYYTDGKGKWVKVTTAAQCEKKILFDQCQGVKGHDYVECWAYKKNGSFSYRNPDGGCSISPPGHRTWISPVDKDKDFYIRHRTSEDLTDPKEIERIEAGRTLPNESVDRPVTKEWLEAHPGIKEKLEERMKDSIVDDVPEEE